MRVWGSRFWASKRSIPIVPCRHPKLRKYTFKTICQSFLNFFGRFWTLRADAASSLCHTGSIMKHPTRMRSRLQRRRMFGTCTAIRGVCVCDLFLFKLLHRGFSYAIETEWVHSPKQCPALSNACSSFSLPASGNVIPTEGQNWECEV